MKPAKALALSLALFLTGCGPVRELPTVDEVSLDRYAGLWYEVARLPFFFERDCKCVTAEYGLTDKDYITVKNSCVKITSGKLKVAEGRAWPVAGSGNSRLKVSFFRPFKGDYYIIELAEDYSHALVGSPDRGTLWILARNRELPANVIEQLTARARELGFPASELIWTVQDC